MSCFIYVRFCILPAYERDYWVTYLSILQEADTYELNSHLSMLSYGVFVQVLEEGDQMRISRGHYR
jgi:hypothetical protein